MDIESDGERRRELVRILEGLEAEAYADGYEALGAEAARALGAAVERRGSVTLLRLAALPIPMFNRAIGLGVWEPAEDGAIAEALAFFRDAGV